MTDIAASVREHIKAIVDEAIRDAIAVSHEALHTKFDAVLQGLHHLITKDTDMTKAHDDLLAAAKDADAQADALIAAKSSGDGKLTDILAVVSGTRDKLAAAAKADKDDEDAKGVTDAAGSIVTAAASTTVLDSTTGLPVTQ